MKISRRAFLSGIAVSAAGLAGCLAPRRSIDPTPTRAAPTLQPPTVEAGQLTPIDQLYVQSYQPNADPVKREAWRLQISGQAEQGQPLTLTWADVQSMPQAEQMHTLECIGNPVGGNKIGNQIWKGVRLREVLALAHIAPVSDHLVMSGADDYFTCVPLELALDERSLIAVNVAGADLPGPHGFPARVLLPGVYGQKQPKWLTGLQAVTGYQPGTWERQGWSDSARIQINSQINFPPASSVFPAGQPLTISGTAFADDSGVARVEVSVDGGEHWAAAELFPGPSSTVWTLWRWVWAGPAAGHYTVQARATSGAGQTQPDQGGFLSNVFPNGTSSIHSRNISAA